MSDLTVLIGLVALAAGLLWRLDWLDRKPRLVWMLWTFGVYWALFMEFTAVAQRTVDHLPRWEAAVVLLVLYPVMGAGALALIYVAFRSWYNRLPAGTPRKPPKLH